MPSDHTEHKKTLQKHSDSCCSWCSKAWGVEWLVWGLAMWMPLVKAWGLGHLRHVRPQGHHRYYLQGQAHSHVTRSGSLLFVGRMAPKSKRGAAPLCGRLARGGATSASAPAIKTLKVTIESLELQFLLQSPHSLLCCLVHPRSWHGSLIVGTTMQASGRRCS